MKRKKENEREREREGRGGRRVGRRGEPRKKVSGILWKRSKRRIESCYG